VAAPVADRRAAVRGAVGAGRVGDRAVGHYRFIAGVGRVAGGVARRVAVAVARAVARVIARVVAVVVVVAAMVTTTVVTTAAEAGFDCVFFLRLRREGVHIDIQARFDHRHIGVLDGLQIESGQVIIGFRETSERTNQGQGDNEQAELLHRNLLAAGKGVFSCVIPQSAVFCGLTCLVGHTAKREAGPVVTELPEIISRARENRGIPALLPTNPAAGQRCETAGKSSENQELNSR